MIKENMSDLPIERAIINTQDTVGNSTALQQVVSVSDTLNIKLVAPKLNIPQATTNSKLQGITEKIREVDPASERPIKNYTKKVVEVIDTTPKVLYNPDTVPFLISSEAREELFQQNYFLNIPDSKPGISLVDTNSTAALNVKQVAKKGETIKFAEETKSFIYKTENANVATSYSAEWIPISLMVLFILFAWIRVFYNKVLRLTLRSAFNYLISNRLYRERNSITIWGSFILNIFYFLSGGLFLYLLFTYFGYRMSNYGGLSSFFIFSAGLVVLYLGKQIILKILSAIFQDKGEISEYIHNVFIFNKTLGVVLLPGILAIPFIPEPGKEILLKAGIIVIFVFYILRIIRGLRIGFRINISILYLILYLCSLEFFPLLLLYKVFMIYTS